jgi:hypothetical protein
MRTASAASATLHENPAVAKAATIQSETIVLTDADERRHKPCKAAQKRNRLAEASCRELQHCINFIEPLALNGGSGPLR